jgi:hypothetical protein
LQNVLPQGGVNNQTDSTTGGSDDNNYNQTNTTQDVNSGNTFNQPLPGTNLRLPARVNPLVK